MKVYQIMKQIFYSDSKGHEIPCGMCFEEGRTYSSKIKAEKAITKILEKNNLSWKDVNLFPKVHFEIITHPEYNRGNQVRKSYWLNEIEVL